MLKALIIDDAVKYSDNLRRYMQEHEDRSSFLHFSQVDIARSGSEALRLAEAGVEYDLIIYDLLLPWESGGKRSRTNGMRLIGEVRSRQSRSCGVLATAYINTQEAATIERLGVVGRIVAKSAGFEALLVSAQDALLEAAQVSSRRLAATYRLQARIHEAMNSLNNVLAAVSEIEKICSPTEGFAPSRSLPLIREEVAHIRRFQHDAERSLRDVNGDEQPRREPCDLAEIAGWCVSYLKSQDRKGRRHIVLDLEGTIPRILGLHEELRQMILVIATNALQATGEEGRVTIYLRREQEGDREICITVEDDGLGIPEVIRARAFELGFSTRGGSGMGLFLARAFAWNHGGRIDIEGPSSGRTRVTVQLPVRAIGVDG